MVKYFSFIFHILVPADVSLSVICFSLYLVCTYSVHHFAALWPLKIFALALL